MPYQPNVWRYSSIDQGVTAGKYKGQRDDVFTPGTPVENIQQAIADMIAGGGKINANGQPLYAEVRDVRTPEQISMFNQLVQQLQAGGYQGQYAAPMTAQETAFIDDTVNQLSTLKKKLGTPVSAQFPAEYFKTNVEDPARKNFNQATVPSIQNLFLDAYQSGERGAQIRKAGVELDNNILAQRANLAYQTQTEANQLNAAQDQLLANVLAQSPDILNNMLSTQRSIDTANLQGKATEYARVQDLMSQLSAIDFTKERTPVDPDMYREDPAKFLDIVTTQMKIDQAERESQRNAGLTNRQLDIMSAANQADTAYKYTALSSSDKQAANQLGLNYAQLKSSDLIAAKQLGLSQSQLTQQARQAADALGLDWAKLKSNEQSDLRNYALQQNIATATSAYQTGQLQLGNKQNNTSQAIALAQLKAQGIQALDQLNLNYAQLSASEYDNLRNYNLNKQIANSNNSNALAQLAQAQQIAQAQNLIALVNNPNSLSSPADWLTNSSNKASVQALQDFVASLYSRNTGNNKVSSNQYLPRQFQGSAR